MRFEPLEDYRQTVPYRMGVFEAMKQGAGFAWEEVKERWRLGEASFIDPETHAEIVGERPIPWDHRMTEQRARILAMEHDRGQYMQQFESRPFAEFFGALPVWLFDPVTVFTLPIGGPNLRAASKAPTLARMLVESAKAGAKIGAASFPLEVAVEQTTRGEVRPDMLAGATLGPLVFAPIVPAGVRAFRGARNRAKIGPAASAIDRQAAAAGVDPEAPIRAAAEGAASPPLHTAPGEPPAGTRAQQLFEPYDGGPTAWLRDLAEGAPSAREFAARIGIDPDAPAIRDLISRMAFIRAGREVTTDAAARFTQSADFVAAVRGQASPEQIARLRAAGALSDVEAARAAGEVRGAERTAPELIAARQAERAAAEVAEMGRLDPAFRELAEALMTPAFRRTAPQRLLVRDFERAGADGVHARYAENLEQRYDAVVKEARALRDARQGKPGRPPKAHTDRLAELDAERQRLWNEQLRVKAILNNIDDVPTDELMRAVEAARYDAPVGEGAAAGRPTEGADALAMLGRDPELDDMMAFASAVGKGEEAESALRAATRFLNDVNGCRSG